MALANFEPTDSDKAYEQQAKTADTAPVAAPKEAPIEVEPAAPSEPVQAKEAPAPSLETGDEKPASDPVKVEEKKAEAPSPRAKVPAPKLVPVGAMLEERHQRQAYEKELADVRKELAALRKPPAEPPDPNLDPDGHTRYELNQLKRQVQEQVNVTEAQKKVQEQQTQYNRRIQEGADYEIASLEEFKTARPEDHATYGEATEFYRSVMRQILPTVGVKEPGRIEHTITDLILRAAEDAKANGENAAERIFKLATAVGFKAQARKAPVEAAPAIPQPVSENEELIRQVNDKLAVLTEGHKASKSIASSGKSSQGLTLDELVASAKGVSLLEETELDKIPIRKAKRQLFRE